MLSSVLISVAVLLLVSSAANADVGLTSTALSTFSSGSDGLYVFASSSSSAGYCFVQIGDHNNDGFVDMAIGATTAAINGQASAGLAIVILGQSNFTNIDISTAVSGATLRRIYTGISTNLVGSSLGGAGDVNADGFADLLVSAPNYSYNGAATNNGAFYIIFGTAGPYVDVVLGASFVAGSIGYALYTSMEFSQLGSLTANSRGLGDINGDGIDDFAISANPFDYAGRNAAGAVWVVYGKPTATTPADINLDTPGSWGVTIGGSKALDRAGCAIDSAGDFNNDGKPDFILGANGYDPVVGGVTRNSAGAAYLIFGTGSALSSLDLLNFVTGAAGVRFIGAAAINEAGGSVSGAGDINNDGFDDLLIGARYFAANGKTSAGVVYVIFGTNAAFSADVDLLGWAAGARGFAVLGGQAQQQLGSAVSRAGDVDNDNIADILFAGSGNPVRAYVLSGSTTNPAANVDIATATDLYSFQGITSIASLYGGSDVNGDGYADLMLGSPGATNTGQGYMVLGPLPRTNTFSPTMQPTRPTAKPTALPSALPTAVPSAVPTADPSAVPSAKPTSRPSSQPSGAPSGQPSTMPSGQPSGSPSTQPTSVPTVQPSGQPSSQPTSEPSGQPSTRPSAQPSSQPSAEPTSQPSSAPSAQPSAQPTVAPSAPTVQPSGSAGTGGDVSSPGLSDGGIAGVVVGGVLFLLLLLIALVAVLRLCAQQTTPTQTEAAPAQYEMTQVEEA